MRVPSKSRLKRTIVAVVLLVAVCFVIVQFVSRPRLGNPPVTGDFEAPLQVKNILKNACYDCHSNETNLRWYDKINPVYWQVAKDVEQGRAVLNFSEWDKMPAASQSAFLWEAVNQIQMGDMPLPSYRTVHPGTKVTPAQLSILKKYLVSMLKGGPDDTSKVSAFKRQYSSWTKGKTETTNVPVALNGIAYIPDYKNWKVVTTSDRFDNGSMRVIFGNAIAIKAIAEHQVNPWPNGTIFAKVGWDKLTDADGNVKTGAFKQVEYMIKDDKKYKSTAGWGFARFKTPQMLPYGKTKLFANECVNCHRPMSNNDFVFTFPVKH
jgi:hypothetical protein